MITVAHTRDYRGPMQRVVYIGRPSIYGNRHPLGRTCPVCRVWHTRESCIEAFKVDWESPRYLLIRETALREIGPDVVLLCFCAPQACHGDVIADWLNGHHHPVLPNERAALAP